MHAIVDPRVVTAPNHSDKPKPTRICASVPTDQLEDLGTPGRTPTKERFVLARTPGLPAFEVFDIKNSTRQWKVFHTLFDFCVPNKSVQRGEQRWAYRGRDYEGRGTSTMIMEPGEVHRTIKVARPADFLVLRVEEKAMTELTLELGHGAAHFRTGQIEDRRAHAAISQAALELVEGSADPIRIESMLIEFLRRALRLGGDGHLQLDPTPCKNAVERARQYIHGHFDAHVSLDDVAAASERTKWHLARSFKELIGVTIHDYLTLVRLAHAEKFLRRGIAPSIAASDVGFADQAHLTRKLRRNLGITPGRDRLARRNEERS